MVKILGTGTTKDGQEYVMVGKTEFEELQSAKLLLDFAKQHGKEEEVLTKLTGLDPYKVKQNPDGTYAHVPKEVEDSVIKALTKPKHPKGVTEEDENSYYKLRSDWWNVKL